MNSAASHFGDLLRRYRLAAGLTQELLAERACLSREAISTLERGERLSPRKETVTLLADALALPPDDRQTLVAAAERPHRPRLPAPSTVTQADGPHAMSASAARAHAPARLPLPPTALIGRATDLEEACALLRRPEVRLLTFIGPGGVGKTRLALEVAARIKDEFADGAVFIELAPLRDPALVIKAIAQAFEVREEQGQLLLPALIAALRPRHVLLVLDNFEHVLAAAPILAAPVADCPQVTLLVTSRSHLNLRGEYVLSIAPLPTPTDPAIQASERAIALGARPSLPTVAQIVQVPAVALFIARARATSATFAVTEANSQAIAALCRHLDGLPLAIELAAARVRLLPPHALLARLLDRRFALLVGGAQDLPERQQTLHDAIAWSYDLLGHEGQALFRRLAICNGGCTLEAAQVLGGESTADATLDCLDALVGHSLLRMTEQANGEPRFDMLESLREYGLEQLEATGELADVGRAHATYYLALAERAEPLLTGPEQATWLDCLEMEHDNLRAALRWASTQGDGALALHLSGLLWRFWYLRGHLSEGRDWLVRALDGAAGVAIAPAIRARALHGIGTLAFFQNDYAQALSYLEQSLTLRQESGDPQGMVATLNNIGLIAQEQGDLDRAAAQFEECLRLRNGLGEWPNSAAPIYNLASVVFDQGDYARATTLFTETLAIERADQNRHGIATALNALGLLALHRGEPERAAALLDEGIALLNDLGNTHGLADALSYRAAVARMQGDYERALTLYGRSIGLAQQIEYRGCIVSCIEGIAGVGALLEHPAPAARLLGAATVQRAALNIPLARGMRTLYDRDEAMIRQSLAADAYGHASQSGHDLSFAALVAEAQAVAHALLVEISTPATPIADPTYAM